MGSEKLEARSEKLRTVILFLVLAVQIAAIGFLIVRYERVVSQGTEVRFKCQAYDPYDPLRGRYLRTSVEQETANLPHSITNIDFTLRNRFVARIEPGTNGLWRVAEVALAPTDEGLWVKPKSSHLDYRLTWSERNPEENWEAFDKRREASGIVARVTFPNQLFSNEKIAPMAEKLLREKSDDAVAVYRVHDGEIVITDIEIGGKSILQCIREAK